jgi:hypothetical protein
VGTLTAAIEPSTATFNSVTWSSGNIAFATVTSNNSLSTTVTAVAAGTTTITANVDGKIASCTVTVAAGPGTGTAGDPYLVYDIETLEAVGRGIAPRTAWTLNKSYKLVNNIDMGDKSWTPIGNYLPNENPFTGNFDGGSKKIIGLTIINNPNDDYQGMFGYVDNGAKISNLALINCNIIGSDYVGGVVGTNFGTVINCNTTGTIKGSSYVGGVVGGNGGYYEDGTVKNCYSTGTVSGLFGVGGVVGGNYGTVEKCYSTGNITGDGDDDQGIGGVVGGNFSTVRNCYATGDVSGNEGVGGVVGGNYGTLENCYATGNVSGNSSVGGVVGDCELYHNDDDTVKNCVGLNKTITYKSDLLSVYGRVAGYGYGTLINNYGRADMVNSLEDAWKLIDLDADDGENITSTQWNNANWWTGTDNWNLEDEGSVWDQDVWNIVNGSLPTLKGMPAGEQKPMIQNN